MQFSTLTLAAFGVIGTSATAQWAIYSRDNTGFFMGGGDDVIEGLPAFLAYESIDKLITALVAKLIMPVRFGVK
ncbi:hypothetical protein E0Z10_g10143 [Xylaria hypoxylon]|uniref:Uncharacterized protein n=1 Tax=Xylaria hypoxylon TaxID=37992 RepID=A0A4Z0YFF3_9PEZI|nr:hypothetical protein E0Z10_g10143 [Xylaria hypoxylon]